MSLQIVPCTIKDANVFVREYHRHHGPVVSGLFAVAAAESQRVVAVAIVGRPVARLAQDGWTAEVTRLASDGTANACSLLYAACWRAARALGWRRLITYTLASESGASLRAAGWRVVGQVTARQWSCPSRPRVENPRQAKLRWEAPA